ncbi:MAG: hypothetical protein M3O46_18235 [Myxococcota bacterium]|nr:hypothetical protein [Myxococcota bacterium]
MTLVVLSHPTIHSQNAKEPGWFSSRPSEAGGGDEEPHSRAVTIPGRRQRAGIGEKHRWLA